VGRNPIKSTEFDSILVFLSWQRKKRRKQARILISPSSDNSGPEASALC